MSQIAERTDKALRQSEALLEGHFLLSSGRHAARYVQCARLLQYTDLAAQVCADLAEKVKQHTANDKPFDVVLGPAMGAVTFSYELARAFNVRGLFAERAASGGFELRRGFEIEPHERVLVAEDVVTTGKSAGEVVTMLREMGVSNISAASIVNRSGVDNPFGDEVDYYSCIDVDVPSYDASQCPLCESSEHGEAYKPGSRPNI
ncbi:MAG: orotate phosphoribosyltransferase [Planctomycetota bacterium]|jgi:orotate phosphoribosyltransferase|nr:orotate phosphoribosyltransferase [Planctomycetota bacterium]